MRETHHPLKRSRRLRALKQRENELEAMQRSKMAVEPVKVHRAEADILNLRKKLGIRA